MHSAIYEGIVTHHRRQPITHQFQYRLFMVLLDLEELPSLLGGGGLIARSRHASRSFLRSDHLFRASEPLDAEVREIVREQTGRSPRGRIRLLTQLRYFRFYFSPLNLFYVYDENDQGVEFVVAEVNNTPWNERHCYVLWDGNRTDSDTGLEFRHPKQFHVSPFMNMDLRYHWRLSEPGERLQVQLANYQDSQQLFGADMALQRREMTAGQLRRMTLRYPVMTAQISLAIYMQALRLWWKKCPFYSNPKKLSNRS